MQHILNPFDIRESMEVAAAAKYAGRVTATIRTWCVRYGVGRKIAGDWHVSRVALRMFLDGNSEALAAYHAGDRSSAAVVDYFSRAGLAGLCTEAATKEKMQTIAQVANGNGSANRITTERDPHNLAGH